MDPRCDQKYLTISSFDLTLISNICTKITYSLRFLVQINKLNLFKFILYCPFFVICRIFHYVLLDILYLNRHCKASLYNGVNLFHMSAFWYFPPCCFFCHINICILKHTCITSSVCYLLTYEIGYLVMGTVRA